MLNLMESAPTEIASKRTFSDPDDNALFCDVRKRL
jgi:hypothetical protein